MRGSGKILGFALGFWLASSRLLVAQSQAVQSPTGTAEDLSVRVGKLEERVRSIKAELDSALSQTRQPPNPQLVATTSQKAEDLMNRVDSIRNQLESIKRALQNTSPDPPISRNPPQEARVISSQLHKGMAVDLMNEQGQFAGGQNKFCVDFRDLRTGRTVDPGDVTVDFTHGDGPVKLVRAVARITHAEAGHYCGEVSLPMSGLWIVTAKYGGPSGKGKAVFGPSVK